MDLIKLSKGVQWLDVSQNTDEWLDLRMGRVGGSAVGKIMANFGKAFGNPAHEVALRIALERITGERQENNYTNAHMERGHEQEPIARALYEDETFSDVTNGGYFYSGDLYGISPDGIVNDGLIEIKSVISTVHYSTVKRNSFDPKYKWQLLYNMGCSGKGWIDYVEYCSEFPPGKQLFMQTLLANDYKKELTMILERLDEFDSLVFEKTNTINEIGRA